MRIRGEAEHFGLSAVQERKTGRIEGAGRLTEDGIEWRTQNQFGLPSTVACFPTPNDLVPKCLFFKLALSLV